MTAERQDSLFGESQPAEAERQSPSVDRAPFPVNTYEPRTSSAFDELGGRVPEETLDDKQAKPSTRAIAEAPTSGVETEEGRRRLLAVARAGGRLVEDQRYWDDLQDRVKTGTLLQSDFDVEWTREMNRRWMNRQSKNVS